MNDPATKDEAISELRKAFVEGLLDAMGRFEAQRFAGIFFDPFVGKDESIAGMMFDLGVDYEKRRAK